MIKSDIWSLHLCPFFLIYCSFSLNFINNDPLRRIPASVMRWWSKEQKFYCMISILAASFYFFLPLTAGVLADLDRQVFRYIFRPRAPHKLCFSWVYLSYSTSDHIIPLTQSSQSHVLSPTGKADVRRNWKTSDNQQVDPDSWLISQFGMVLGPHTTWIGSASTEEKLKAVVPEVDIADDLYHHTDLRRRYHRSPGRYCHPGKDVFGITDITKLLLKSSDKTLAWTLMDVLRGAITTWDPFWSSHLQDMALLTQWWILWG